MTRIIIIILTRFQALFFSSKSKFLSAIYSNVTIAVTMYTMYNISTTKWNSQPMFVFTYLFMVPIFLAGIFSFKCGHIISC